MSRAAAAALLCAALAAACRRAPEPAPDPAGGVALAAPAPSSATVTSPLAGQSTGYTNEMQAQNLRDEAAQLGITRFNRPAAPGQEEDEGRAAPLTMQEGLEKTHELALALEAQRHALDKGKDKTVVLPTGVPGIIPGKKEGAPIEAAPDDAPKDLETK